MSEGKPSAREVLDGIARRLDGRHLGRSLAIAFVVLGGATHRLIMEDGRCRVVQGEGEATATMRLQPEVAIDVLSGKVDALKAFMIGQIIVEGDVAALMLLGEATPQPGPELGGEKRLVFPDESPALSAWRRRAEAHYPGGITLWGLHDGATWLYQVPPFSRDAPNQPLLFTAQREAKPAYYAFICGLAEGHRHVAAL